MPIYVSGSNRTPAPEGLHNGACADVIDRGLVKTKFGEKHQVRIMWQLDVVNEKINKRFMVGRTYGATLAPKSTLRAHLETWRGKKFTDEELSRFDLEKLIGVPCQVQIVHTIGDDQTKYDNVQVVLPPAKGVPAITVQDYTRVKDRPTEQATGNGHETSEDEIPF